jgi:hypothetical protein
MSTKKRTMRLRKTEWIGIAVVAGSIACFGGWLQVEINRATFARMQRDTLDAHDPRGDCGGMSGQDTEMLSKGELWCGAVIPGRPNALGKL